MSQIEPSRKLPERRRRRRQTFDVQGELLGAGPPTPCRVVNLDAVGAQVRLDGARLLPTHMTLTLLLRQVTVIYSATLLWRRGNLIGLELGVRREVVRDRQAEFSPR